MIGSPIKWAKSILHIGSPSRVFAEIGGDVARGPRASASTAGRAPCVVRSQGLAGATLPAFGAPGGYGAVGGAGGRSVVLHVAPGAVQVSIGAAAGGSVSQSSIDATINRAFRQLAAELSRR